MTKPNYFFVFSYANNNKNLNLQKEMDDCVVHRSVKDHPEVQKSSLLCDLSIAVLEIQLIQYYLHFHRPGRKNNWALSYEIDHFFMQESQESS